jgi:SEC-C motif-containing protein
MDGPRKGGLRKGGLRLGDLHECPCQSAKAYRACCGRWHHGMTRLQAPDAVALMRSRYSAFVLGDLAYLLDTWHPSTRPPHLDGNEDDLKWLGLTIKKHHVTDQHHATVEFVARSRYQGRPQRLHETSRFECIDGHWHYIDGDIHACNDSYL